MRTFLFILFVSFVAAIAAPQSSYAVVTVKGSASAHLAASGTVTKTAIHQFKRPSRFKMWALKTMARATGSDNNVIIALLLTFFLGGLGIHRVYLGSQPIMILWYVITIGGIFGILPLIDFFRILFSGTSHYDNNNSFIAAFE